MNLISIDGFKAPPSEVWLRIDGQKIKLPQAARCQTIDHFANHPPAESMASIVVSYGDRTDQGRELVGLRSTAPHHLAVITGNHECSDVIIHSVRDQRAILEEAENFRKILRACRSDFKLFEIDLH